MPLGLDNNLKILNECDYNSTEKTATDINQAMVIVTIFRGEDPSKTTQEVTLVFCTVTKNVKIA